MVLDADVSFWKQRPRNTQIRDHDARPVRRELPLQCSLSKFNPIEGFRRAGVREVGAGQRHQTRTKRAPVAAFNADGMLSGRLPLDTARRAQIGPVPYQCVRNQGVAPAKSKQTRSRPF